MQKKNHKETGQKTTGISGSHYKHGFLANGIPVGIKENGKNDLALIFS